MPGRPNGHLPGAAIVGELLEEGDEIVPFVDKIRGGAHPLDVPVLLLVPAVLILVYLLPYETRLVHAFDFSNPTIFTAFAANYIHLTLGHLVSNLVAYSLVASVAYLLATATGNRRRFLLAFAGICLVLPTPLSYLNLAIPVPGFAYGFSGLNMAFFGYMLVELSAYLEEYFTTDFGVEHAPVFFFMLTAFIAAPHIGTWWGTGITGTSLAIAVVYGLTYVLSFRPSLSGLKRTLDMQGYVELLILTVAFSLAMVPIAFPQDPTTDAGVVNIFTHFVGFAIGFILVYVWVLLFTDATPREAVPVEPP